MHTWELPGGQVEEGEPGEQKMWLRMRKIWECQGYVTGKGYDKAKWCKSKNSSAGTEMNGIAKGEPNPNIKLPYSKGSTGIFQTRRSR